MKKLLENKTLFKSLFWIWMIILVALSSIPNIPTQKVNIWDEPFRLDYLEHFLVFGGLMALYVGWKSDNNGMIKLSNHYLNLVYLILYAALNESIQIWIPGRTFNPLDLLYNILGLVVFFIISPIIIKQFYKN